MSSRRSTVCIRPSGEEASLCRPFDDVCCTQGPSFCRAFAWRGNACGTPPIGKQVVVFEQFDLCCNGVARRLRLSAGGCRRCRVQRPPPGGGLKGKWGGTEGDLI